MGSVTSEDRQSLGCPRSLPTSVGSPPRLEWPLAQIRWSRWANRCCRPAREAITTGGRSDTGRRAEESHTGREGRLVTGSKIRAMSSLSSVSFSSSSSDEVVEDVAVLDEDLPGLVVRGLDELAHLLVDDLRDAFGVVALVAHVAAEEHLAGLLAELDRTDALAHAVLRDHRAGDGRGLLDVVGRAGRRVVEDELLGRRGRPACRPAGRASRCGSWSTCPRPAAPSCSRARGRAAGS